MRWIDADKLADFVCSVCGGGCDVQNRGNCIERDFTEQCAEEMPTVDAVPVVRCKDCQYSRPNKSGIKLHCAWWYRGVYDDDFCSSGKRRNDGT